MSELTTTEESPQMEVRPRKKTITTMEEVKTMKDTATSKGFQHYFEIGKKIGEGTHSTVFKCNEKETGEQFAVKVIKKRDLELFSHIRQTYRIINKLKSEAIVKPKTLFINEKLMTCHLVQEFCQEPDLGAYLQNRQEKLEAEECSSILQ